MTREWKKHEINRLRTLIAFAYGDMCHGGPNKKPEIARLQQELKDLEKVEVDDEGGPSGYSAYRPPSVGTAGSSSN
jgi:hypothetical protein